MNSREKQRQALHANSSIAARVRQLPLYMKVINVILAIVLAFGVCTNWSFAAEVLHIQVANASEADQSYAEDSYKIEHSETLQVSGLSPDGANSYEWQIYNEADNSYLPIVGQTEKDITVNAGLLENQLNADNTAKLLCLTYDANEEIIAKRVCNVTLKPLVLSNNGQVANNDPDTETLDAQGVANDVEENGTQITVNVKFVDRNGATVSETLSKTFDVPQTGDTDSSWLIKVNPNLGNIYNITNTLAGTQWASAFDAHQVTYEGFTNSISCVMKSGLQTYTGSSVDVIVTLNREAYVYTIRAEYPPLPGQGTESTWKEFNSEAPLATSIPTKQDLDHLRNGCGDATLGTGWTVGEYTGAVVQTNPTTIIVHMVRTYSVLTFNPEGGVNGPASVYMMNGQKYSDIAAWDRGSGVFYPQNEDFYRAQYVLDYWYYLDNGQEVAYPEKSATANWGNLTAPGEPRTFYAKWKFASDDPNAHYRVSLAYYVEKSDSTESSSDPVNPANYEYETTRYDKVYQPSHSGGQKVGSVYTLPKSGQGMNNRTYPQVVSSSDPEGIEVTNTISNIPNSRDQQKDSYRYDELYTYKSCDTGIVTKADGTTVIRIFLQRQTRSITFSWTNYYEAYQSWGSWRWRSTAASKTITAKWDADIKQQFLDLNKQASKEQDRPSSHNPADKKSSDYVTWSPSYQVWCLYIQNMYKYNYSYSYDEAASGEDHIRYYGHKIDAPYGHEGSKSDNYGFHYKAENTQYAANWEYIADIPNEGASTNEEEFIPILGYKTPEPGVDGPALQTSFHDSTYPGLSYYYYRNEFNIILKNLHGIDDIDPASGKMYHYDGNANIGRAYGTQSQDTIKTYQYQKGPIGAIPFVADEKGEQSAYQYTTGISGMKQGMVLGSTSDAEQFIPQTPPNNVDQHFVFAGWYADPNFSGEPIDVDTYYVPNHEIVLYAKWETVERPLRYVQRDPENPTAETYGDVVQEKYLESITHEAPDPSTKDGYKFLGWYYWTDPSKGDVVDNRTWFNPVDMTMPWVDNMEEHGGQYALTLHQAYEKVDYADYRFDFKLWEDGHATDIQVSDSVYGSGTVGDKPSYKVSERYTDGEGVIHEQVPQLYETYDYVYKLRDAYDADHSKTYTFTEPLKFNEENVFTIYYEYDTSKGFHYRTEEWLIYGSDNKEIAMLAADPSEGDRKVDDGWHNNGKDNIVSVPSDPEKWADQGYTLASPYLQTYQLQSDKNWVPSEHDGCLYPLDNIVKIYYKVGDSVDFNFKTATYADSSHTTPLTVEGGSVDPTEIKNVSIDSTADYKSTASPHPGYKFIGWYGSTLSGGEYVVDFNKPLTTNAAVNTKDDPDHVKYGLYTGNLNYFAVFEQDTSENVALDYKVLVYDAFGNAVTVTADDVSIIFDTSGQDPATTLQDTMTALGHYNAGTYTDAYKVKINKTLAWAPFSGWYADDGTGKPGTKLESAYDQDGTFTPPKQHYGPATGGIDYYVNASYICVFDERTLPDDQMINLTYTVTPANYGQVAFNYTGAPWTTEASYTITEKVYPHSGNINISGATSATPKVYGAKTQTYNGSRMYKFSDTGWTYTAGIQAPTIDADHNLTPQRKGEGVAAVYEAATYTANYEKNTHTVKFVADANGKINPDTSDVVVYDGASYSFTTNEQNMTLQDVVSGSSTTTVTKYPIPDAGYTLARYQDLLTNYAWYIRTGDPGSYVDTPLTADEISKGIHDDTTFVVKFKGATNITLTYKVAPYGEPGQQGYTQTPGLIQNTKTAATALTIEDTISPVSEGAAEGWATQMQANGNTGYAFDYWTVDEGTTHYPANPYAYPVLTGTHAQGGTYLYYDGSHTLYAHYKLVNNITINVISSDTSKGTITDGSGGTFSPIEDVVAFTDFSATKEGDDTTNPYVGKFYLGKTPELKANATGISPNEFGYWQYYYTSEATPVYKDVTDSLVINQDITFVANFQVRGNVHYDVHYLYETVEHAKWRAAGESGDEPTPAYSKRSELNNLDPAYSEVDGDYSGNSDAGSAIYINKSAVIGFNTETVEVNTESSYDDSTRMWTIASSGNECNVKMQRNTQFQYKVSYWAETAESAIANPGTEFDTDREYIDTWDMEDEFPNPRTFDYAYSGHYYDFKGVYGDTVYVWENPWQTTDTEFVNIFPSLRNDDTTKKTSDHQKYMGVGTWGAYTDVVPEVDDQGNPVYRNCTEYIIGSEHSQKASDGSVVESLDLPDGWTFNKNTEDCAYCNIYQARNQNYPYAINYWRQKINPETGITSENELVCTVTKENVPQGVGAGTFTAVDSAPVRITNAADNALIQDVNVQNWGAATYTNAGTDIPVTGYEGKPFSELFKGFTYYDNDQDNSTIINHSRNRTVTTINGQTRAVANVYFAATWNNHYTFHFFKETTDHAQWRWNTEQGVTAPEPTNAYSEVTADKVNMNDAQTGQFINLKTSKYVDKYNADGYTWATSTTYPSTEKMVIKPDATDTSGDSQVNVANIYYNADFDMSFTVEYYSEGVNGQGQPSGTYTFDSRSTFQGIQGNTVYVTNKEGQETQPVGTPEVRNNTYYNNRGFTLHHATVDASTTPVDSTTINPGRVIKIYYNRKVELIEWTVEYYIQDISGQSPLSTYSAYKKDGVNPLVKDGDPLGTTGCKTNFSKFLKNGDSYETITGFDLASWKVNEGSGDRTITGNEIVTNVGPDGKGISVLKLYYNRVQTKYNIMYYRETLNDQWQPSGTYDEGYYYTNEANAYYGATITIPYIPPQGYKAITDATKRFLPVNGQIVVGEQTSYEGATDEYTTGRAFFAINNISNYTVRVHRETLNSAVDRRDNESHTRADDVFDASYLTKNYPDYPTKHILVSDTQSVIEQTESAYLEGYEYAYSNPDSTADPSAYITVKADGTAVMDLYYYRTTTSQATVTLKFESVSFAKYGTGDQYDESLTKTVSWNTGVYGETVDLSTIPWTIDGTPEGTPVGDAGFVYTHATPSKDLVYPKTGSTSATVYFDRLDGWYRVGYRTETVAHARWRTHVQEEQPAIDYDIYKPAGSDENGWMYYTDVVGLTIDRETLVENDKPLFMNITGFEREKVQPDHIVITKLDEEHGTYTDDDTIIFYYNRVTNAKYTLNIWKQLNVEPISPAQWSQISTMTATAIYGDTVDASNPDVKAAHDNGMETSGFTCVERDEEPEPEVYSDNQRQWLKQWDDESQGIVLDMSGTQEIDVRYALTSSMKYQIQVQIETLNSAKGSHDDDTTRTYTSTNDDGSAIPITGVDNARIGDVINADTTAVKNAIQKGFTGFTYKHVCDTANKFINDPVHWQVQIPDDQTEEDPGPVIYVQFNRDYYPGPDPATAAFTANYYKESVEHAKWRVTGKQGSEPAFGTYTTKNHPGFFNDEVTYYYAGLLLTDEEHVGYTLNTKLTVYFDGTEQKTDPDGTQFGMNINDKHNQWVNLYYETDYYDPPTDAAFIVKYFVETIEHARYRLGWTTDAPTTDYVEYKAPLYPEGFSPTSFAAFFSEEISFAWTGLKNPSSIEQSIEGFTCDKSLTVWPEGSSGSGATGKFNVDASHTQTVELRYNRDYKEPPTPPVPESSAFKVTYKVQKLESAKQGKTEEADYDVYTDAAGDPVVTYVRGIYGDTVNPEYVTDYSTDPDTMLKDYPIPGFFFGNKWWDSVNQAYGKSFTIDLKTNPLQEIILYYNREHYIPDPPVPDPPVVDATAFTATYMVETEAHAEWRMKGSDPNTEPTPYYEEYKTPGYDDGFSPKKFAAWFGETINAGWKDADGFALYHSITGFVNMPLKTEWPDGTTGTTGKSFTVDATHTQNVKLYYDRKIYDPDPDPDPDPTIDERAGYDVTFMVETVDYCLGLSDVRWEQRHYVAHKAVFGQKVADTSSEIAADKAAFEIDPKNLDGFTYLEIKPVGEFEVTDKFDTSPHFVLYYTRNMTDGPAYNVIKMVKNVDFVTGVDPDPAHEYIQYGTTDEYKAYFEEIIDATRSDLWQEIPDYTFENRCVPPMLQPWTEDTPVLANVVVNDDDNTITGYYDLTTYPQPEHVNGQTGDNLGAFAIGASIAGLMALGLFLALSRRNKNRKSGSHLA